MEKENARQFAIITSEIQQMAREDQEARIADDKSVTIEVDKKNRERLKAIIEQIGWPSKSKVGEDAAHAAWLLAQHADDDPSFQRLCLDLMMAENKDEVVQEDVAYLDDRIRVSEGQPQLYGTQWKVNKEKGYIPEDIADPKNLDQRRTDFGMEPFAEYSEAVQKWYRELQEKRAFDEQNRIKHYLREYLGIEQKDTGRIELLKIKDLPKNYQTQRNALHDERLDGVTVAVVPDDLWVKGSQPSESNAEKQLILIKRSYFETQENPDEIAWMLHELARCQNFLDSASAKEYQANMQRPAFEDLKTEFTYPNNPIEQFTFTKQFQYLKEQGKSREDILAMLGKYYHEEDFPFFNRLLDDISFSSTAPRELHRERISFRDYVIIDEKQEIIKGWAVQIQEILDAINNHDLQNLEKLTERENRRSHAVEVYKTLEKEGLDEEDKTLLAIGLWIQREQKGWSNWRVMAKAVAGGTHSLSSFLRNKRNSTCLDLSVLTKRMAENFHIAGDVELSQLEGRIHHRYFRSNSGRIVDIWSGWKRGGLFQNEKKFEEREEKPKKHLCGK